MHKTWPIKILPEVIGISEAAKLLGVGRKVVYQLLKYGELRALRMNRKILIDPCSLNEFINRGGMA